LNHKHELNPQIHKLHVQPGKSYASVAEKTNSKQSNINQNRQETQGKTTFPSLEQHITSIIQELQNMTKEYMEKMGAMFNSLALCILMVKPMEEPLSL